MIFFIEAYRINTQKFVKHTENVNNLKNTYVIAYIRGLASKSH